MIVGIDVESGERPFHELVEAALLSADRIDDITVVLIGNQKNIEKKFPDINSNNKIQIVNSNEIIYMDESPVSSVRTKKNSTVVTGIKLIKDGSLDAFFSPGNTGATVAASILYLNTIAKIKKPALSTSFPGNGSNETLIIDIGANPESTEEGLCNNAILGMAYYSMIWEKDLPTVGLLNMGSEYGKGSHQIKKAYEKLESIPTFLGNIEGYNLFNGSVDVVVCDGFMGNSIIKMAESMTGFFYKILKSEFREPTVRSHKKGTTAVKNALIGTLESLGAFELKKNNIIQKLYPRFYGGAPLLGVEGLVLVGHGNCSGSDLINAIELANFLHGKDYKNEMRKNIDRFVELRS